MPNKIKLNVLVGNSLLARLAGILLLAQTASADTAGLPPEATKHWTAGNGTYSNPLLRQTPAWPARSSVQIGISRNQKEIVLQLVP